MTRSLRSLHSFAFGPQSRSLTSRRVTHFRHPISPRKFTRHGCTVRAIQISGPENTFDETPESVSDEQRRISSELMQSMQEKIQEALEADKVQVTDTYGDGRHVSIDVTSKLFEGQSSMKRQRMVYKAIWLELQDTVHAVDAMTTKTPAEAAS
ncbi:g926 [Coccomyxa viridis]|uniref:G926 protein n=1 Tax=Coccomyxa viridis TaxID=1274662 RepID=A0ABP1FM37_9CHLO